MGTHDIEIARAVQLRPIQVRTLPGLPKAPGAESIDIDADGNGVGLF